MLTNWLSMSEAVDCDRSDPRLLASSSQNSVGSGVVSPRLPEDGSAHILSFDKRGELARRLPVDPKLSDRGSVLCRLESSPFLRLVVPRSSYAYGLLGEVEILGCQG